MNQEQMHKNLKEAPELSEVEARFRELPGQYHLLKQECEARVVRWRWASDDLYEPRPLFFERHGYRKGRFLSTPPKNQADKPEYGLGTDGLIHIARKHVRFDGYPERLWFYETFYIHSHEQIAVSHFDYHPNKEPIFFALGNYANQQLAFWRVRARQGMSRETYSWEGGKLRGIDVEHTPVEKNGNHRPVILWNQYLVQYNVEGAIEEILCHWPLRPDSSRESTEVIYRRLPSTVTFADLLLKMRSVITKAIIDSVGDANISEPVYSLALAWDPGQQESLPPSIGIGTHSERTGWIEKHGDEARWYLWNPAEYQHFLEIQSEDVENACRPVNQECRLRASWKEAARALNQVAHELGHMNWSGKLETTDDFVCYAVDLQLTEFRCNLKASARPELINAFRKKGWLLP